MAQAEYRQDDDLGPRVIQSSVYYVLRMQDTLDRSKDDKCVPELLVENMIDPSEERHRI